MPVQVLMLLNAHYPADIRVKKEADALIKAGFEVNLLCLRRKSEPYSEEFEKVNIRRLDGGRNNYQLAFWDVVMSTTFLHPRFKKVAQRLIEEKSVNLIHVHDLPLAGTALALKKNESVKVILDLHENYPEALRTWFKWKKNPIVRIKNSLFMNPIRWTKLEKLACKETDQIVAVVEEMKDRLIQTHSVKGEKITVVTNTEDKHFIEQPIDNSVYNDIPSGFTITYSGGIGPHRGVDIAIRGMSYLAHLPIHLAIVGFGSSAVMKNLNKLVDELKLKNIHFLGYQPFSKFYSYMHLADANVIPHQSNAHTDNTVPHKLFQGMMAAKPLIVSSCSPIKRYVRSFDCGIVFNAGDARDFAHKTEMLYQNKSLQSQLGKNGFDASIRGNLNWETTQRTLIDLYNRISRHE